MGIFKSIMDKIFHHSSTDSAAAPAPAQQPTQSSTVNAASVSTPLLQAVDVDAVLTKLTSSKGGGGIGGRQSWICSSCLTWTRASPHARISLRS